MIVNHHSSVQCRLQLHCADHIEPCEVTVADQDERRPVLKRGLRDHRPAETDDLPRGFAPRHTPSAALPGNRKAPTTTPHPLR